MAVSASFNPWPVKVQTTTPQPPSGGAEYFAVNLSIPNANLYRSMQDAGIVLMTLGAAGFGGSYLLNKRE